MYEFQNFKATGRAAPAMPWRFRFELNMHEVITALAGNGRRYGVTA